MRLVLVALSMRRISFAADRRSDRGGRRSLLAASARSTQWSTQRDDGGKHQVLSAMSALRYGVGVSADTELPSATGCRRTALAPGNEPNSATYFALATRMTS
jgi:hypothetical protein